jgi:Ycf66 protein N-terminus
MLAYILAVLVGTSSVGLYLWAFFFPEIHRKQDFIWSGVGLFYALFLWLYAHQVTGGILVGQTTSVALLGWFAWETFKLRRQLVPIDRSTVTVAPNPTQPQNQRDSKPKAVKPSIAPTPTPTPTPTVVTTKTAPVVTSIPLDRTKVPPATPRSAPASKAAPPQPTKPVNTAPVPVVPSNPTASPTTSSPAADVPAKISRSIDVPVQVATPAPTSTPTPSAANNSIDVTEETWIKLEVKPAPALAKPLGTPAQPPTAAKAEAQSTAVVPEIVTQNPPTDPAQATTELESENWV